MQPTVILLSKLFVISLSCYRSDSVTKNVEAPCPCMSYYSQPNYDCLFKRLDQNETLSPLCFQLLQGLEVEHKFIITEKDGFQCADKKVYQYVDLQKEVLQMEDCHKMFENAQIFEIVSPRKQYFDIVSGNLGLLGFRKISCQLEVAGVRQENDLTCEHWPVPKSPGAWVNESFLYEDGKVIEGNMALLRCSEQGLGDKFNVGFVFPNVTEKEVSPGQIIINIRNLYEFFYGHLLKFSCQWGKDSLYFGRTESCSQRTYYDHSDSNVRPATHGPVQSRQVAPYSEWSIALSLMFQRVIKNSTLAVKLLWKEYGGKELAMKIYETLCKFFDTDITVYQPPVCSSCWKYGNNCTKCWETADLMGHFSPFLKIRTSDFSYQKLIILQTNHQNITTKNGSFQTIPKHVSPFYDMFQYDYFFGNYSAYMPKHDVQEPKDEHEPYFSRSVILPGPQSTPADLSKQQLKSTSMICRTRAVSREFMTEWSNPVWTTFNKNIFTPSCVTLLINYRFSRVLFPQVLYISVRTNFLTSYINIEEEDENIEFHKGDNTIDLSNNFPMRQLINPIHYADLHIFSKITVKNQLFARQYKFAKSSLEHNGSSSDIYILHYAAEKSGKMIASDVYAESEPFDLKCAALHPFILWTEKSEGRKFKLVQARLDKQSGKPLEKVEMNSEKVCACSTQKYITSPSVEILYRNFSDPQEVEIVVVCGNKICIININTEVSTKTLVPLSLWRRTVVSISADQNFCYIVTNDDKQWLYIVPLGETDDIHSKQFDAAGNIWWIQSTSEKQSIFLPVPFKHCMDPYINEDETTVAISGSYSMTIQLAIEWDDKKFPICAQFSKPSVSVDISYAKVPHYIKLNEDDPSWIHMTCTSLPVLKCKSLPTSVLHGLTAYTVNISEILPNRFYLIELKIKASITQKTYDMWYAGDHTNLRQIFRKIIFVKSIRNKLQGDEEPLISNLLVIAISVAIMLLLLVVCGVLYWKYTRKMYMYKHLNRLAAKDIHKEEKLGEGNFGEVWKATLGNKTIVIKMLKESATDREEKEFRDEALLLAKFHSDNIIQTVGICLQSRPIMLGLEFMNGGSLDTYLKRSNVRSILQSNDLLQITQDALKGCVYLEDEGYIHRDIASRNCLVSTLSESNPKPKCVKLSDFGLAKDVGVESAYRSRNPDEDTLPIAWTAPEAFSGKFSWKSDVWAFGVLIWEIFTWAAAPFGQCSDNDYRHICPMNEFSHDEIEFEVCAERKTLLSFRDPCIAAFCAALKNILQICWQFYPDERPSFKQLQKYLNGAKAEITKLDVQKCFLNITNPGQLEQVQNKKIRDELTVSGSREKRSLMQAAYKTADDYVQEDTQSMQASTADEDQCKNLEHPEFDDVEVNPFSKDYKCAPADNEETVELLQVI